jgi:hypothetical protein
MSMVACCGGAVTCSWANARPHREVENASIAVPIAAFLKEQQVLDIVVSYRVQIIVTVAGWVLRSRFQFFEEVAMMHKMTRNSLAASKQRSCEKPHGPDCD